ncbi:VWA domain-containing protein [Gordonia sp. (in: high G+C Gram-positive bacteria)]|uniref:VWA domain-containing protein n=1 Tax=Gordonia sp. (in: high G+C Gram-positive bacteria) TaxID=84139 RepID=UPI0016925C9E|nr:VWA domain-containing protein [Gordonia sp. (in: high G+C Gram-positive bacteria)]NLG45768.1 VWA domain-containing protein [Gordonia sp. (in: high G+C Gram-positive bacteria)]
MTAPHYPFTAVVGADALDDPQPMALALLLTAISPAVGGVLVRGEKGTAKSTIVRALAAVLPPLDDAPVPLVELPVGATEDRVVGSIDLEAALGEGKARYQPGLLAKAHRGILYVDEVNLLHDHLVDLLLDAAAMGRATVERDGISMSHDARFVLVGTMNPEEGELRPQLLDRFGLTVEVAAPREAPLRAAVVRRRMAFDADPAGFTARYADSEAALRARILAAQQLLPQVQLSSAALLKIAEVCAAFDVDGLRADIVTARTAVAHAAWCGRTGVTIDDIRVAARLALPHRRRRNPFDAPGLDEDLLDRVLGDDDLPPDPPEGGGPDGGDSSDDGADDAPPTAAPDAPAHSTTDAPDGTTADAPPRSTPDVPPRSTPDTTDVPPRSTPDTADVPPRSTPDSADVPPRSTPDSADVPPRSTPDATDVPPRWLSRSEALAEDRVETAAGTDATTTIQAGAPYRTRLFTVAGTGAGTAGRRSRARTSSGRRVGADPAATTGAPHLVETIRSAIPHQHRRGRTAGRLLIEPADLRRAEYEGRESNLVLFCVDASGSMAARRRMAQVKTAVLSLLLDAYQRRDKVGLVTFRGSAADLALPPTSSVDVAAARLAELPAGGRTPLAEGLVKAAEVIAVERIRDARRRPLLVIVTDGRATAGADAVARSREAAGHLAGLGVAAVVIDCESGPLRLGLAAELARHLGAEYLEVGDVSAGDLVEATRNATLGRGAA